MSSFVPGEFGPQWLACDFSLRGWPGCDEGGRHQRWSGDHGERGQGLPQTGAGKPDGRLEVLHLLWFSGLSAVVWHTGGDVLGIHCSVHEHEVCINHDVEMSLIWKCKRRHSCWISSTTDLYQMDHLVILNVTSIIIALLWLTVPRHWQTCRLCLLVPTVESLLFFLLCMFRGETFMAIKNK